MSGTVTLPPELILEILARIPAKADLLRFRLINKDIGALATRQGFNTIKVDFDRRTALGFIALQSSDLAKHVEKVEFLGARGSAIDFYDDADCDYGYYSDTDYSPGMVKEFRAVRLKKSKAVAALYRGFSGLENLTGLRQLTLDFFDKFRESDWADDDPEDRASLPLLFQRHLLTAITQNVNMPCLTTLKLFNLIAAPCAELYSNPSFQQFISIPKHLTIAVLWAADEESGDFDDEDVYAQDLQQFWTNHIINDILLSSNKHLKSLYLTSPEFVQMPCDTLTFPHLTTLSLSNVFFDAVESLILRHKASLRHLRLDVCPISHTEDEPPPRFWFDIWDTFAEDLRLLSFTFTTDISYAFKDPEYWTFGDSNSLYNTHKGKELPMIEESCRDVIHQDKKALKRFRLLVKKRARSANQKLRRR
ncbi:hypothetical protein C8J56DRAFT_989379, partial [Mycena floridula]